MKNENLSIEKRIEESGLFYFDDGYLGSTCHGAGYYEGRDDINGIKSEDDLNYIILDRSRYDGCDISEESWDDFFNKWFNDCDDFNIIEDTMGCGLGYGKIVLDKVNKSIKIMVVPVLVNNNGDERLVFGFEDNGNLINIIDNNELDELLESDEWMTY